MLQNLDLSRNYFMFETNDQVATEFLDQLSRNCRHISEINLSDFSFVNNELALINFINALTKLEVCILKRCSLEFITNEDFKANHKLSRLDLSCNQIPASSLYRFLITCPH